MSTGSFDDRSKHPERDGSSNPECIEVRHEIMTVIFGEKGIVGESVSIHVERCTACREWEAEFKKMHDRCRTSAEGTPSRSTSDILEGWSGGRARTRAPRDEAALAAGHALDRGALFVVLLGVALFQTILAALLAGSARLLCPIFCSVAMLAPTLWVYFDSGKKQMPTAFWMALQPFTVPIGLVAYLICRGRESGRCPECGAFAPSSRRFCASCGGKLAEFCCGCGRPIRKEYRICPHCGQRLEECFSHDDVAGRACRWSSAQTAFLVGVNAALLAGLLAVLLRGDARASLISAFVCLFGPLPVFNWVSIDSRRRAMNSIAWGALALVALYAGLIVYLACRRDVRVECPVCGSYPPASFNFCPCCGSSLGPSCPACGAPAAPGERFCASCGDRLP